MKLESFVEKLKRAHGSNLLSIILYGSAAGKDFQEKFSDINLMVVLKDLSLEEMARSAKLCQKWPQGWLGPRNPLPLLVDPEYLKTSCDVFPLEFLDMKENHRILFGQDLFTNMQISTEHLRLECESELKGKILSLSQGFLNIYPSKRRTKKMMLATSSSLFAIFRGFLRLLKEPVPQTKREVLKKLNEKKHFDTAIFEKILDLREGKYKLKRKEILPWMAEYLTTLRKIARVADTL